MTASTMVKIRDMVMVMHGLRMEMSMKAHMTTVAVKGMADTGTRPPGLFVKMLTR